MVSVLPSRRVSFTSRACASVLLARLSVGLTRDYSMSNLAKTSERSVISDSIKIAKLKNLFDRFMPLNPQKGYEKKQFFSLQNVVILPAFEINTAKWAILIKSRTSTRCPKL